MTFVSQRSVRALALGLLLTVTSPSPGALPADCTDLGSALVEHSCFHAELGPFTRVNASSGVPPADAAPNVDAVHTYYDVNLSNPLGQSTVTYRVASAARAGSWAIFHDPEIPLVVLNEAGTEQPMLLEADVPSCPPLPHAKVYQLGDERYRLVLGPSVKTHGLLVIENVDDFLVFAGVDRDGDGYGDPRETVTTACKPNDGYVANDQDCDDADPNVHPRAPELCDGFDQNCNGLADDAGLPCDRGTGKCKSRGMLACSTDAASCIAPELEPQAERCDGEDDDCDGVNDLNETGLCLDDTGNPRCIRVLGRVRCGCDTDADCGDSQSGQVCNLETRSCEAGCVALPGRNGCEPPLVCTSADPRVIGRCELTEGACTEDGDCPPPPEEAGATAGGGCGCRVGPAEPGSGLLIGALTLALLACRRRATKGAAL